MNIFYFLSEYLRYAVLAVAISGGGRFVASSGRVLARFFKTFAPCCGAFSHGLSPTS
jgi:hypothetical protein